MSCPAAQSYANACTRERTECAPEVMDALNMGDRECALSAHGRPLTDVDLRCISEALRMPHTLRCLSLEENAFGLDGVTAILDALAANPGNLLELRLGKNKLKDPSVISIATTLMTTPLGLKVIDLGDNGVTKLGCDALCQALVSKDCSLIEVSLHSNQLEADSGVALAKAIRTSILKHLHLGYNQLRDAGATQLARCIPIASTLTTLDLTSNRIGPQGGQELARALMSGTCTLQRLNLRHNNFDNETIQLFSEVLLRNTSLTQLFLGFMNPSPETAAMVLTSLRQNRTLLLLDIYGWKLDLDTTGQVIEDIMFHNMSVRAITSDACQPIYHTIDKHNQERDSRSLHEVYIGPDDRHSAKAAFVKSGSRGASRSQQATSTSVSSPQAFRATSPQRGGQQFDSQNNSVQPRALSPQQQQQQSQSSSLVNRQQSYSRQQQQQVVVESTSHSQQNSFQSANSRQQPQPLQVSSRTSPNQSANNRATSPGQSYQVSNRNQSASSRVSPGRQQPQVSSRNQTAANRASSPGQQQSQVSSPNQSANNRATSPGQIQQVSNRNQSVSSRNQTAANRANSPGQSQVSSRVSPGRGAQEPIVNQFRQQDHAAVQQQSSSVQQSRNAQMGGVSSRNAQLGGASGGEDRGQMMQLISQMQIKMENQQRQCDSKVAELERRIKALEEGKEDKQRGGAAGGSRTIVAANNTSPTRGGSPSRIQFANQQAAHPRSSSVVQQSTSWSQSQSGRGQQSPMGRQQQGGGSGGYQEVATRSNVEQTRSSSQQQRGSSTGRSASQHQQLNSAATNSSSSNQQQRGGGLTAGGNQVQPFGAQRLGGNNNNTANAFSRQNSNTNQQQSSSSAIRSTPQHRPEQQYQQSQPQRAGRPQSYDHSSSPQPRSSSQHSSPYVERRATSESVMDVPEDVLAGMHPAQPPTQPNEPSNIEEDTLPAPDLQPSFHGLPNARMESTPSDNPMRLPRRKAPPRNDV